jgi:hypothetical protein
MGGRKFAGMGVGRYPGVVVERLRDSVGSGIYGLAVKYPFKSIPEAVENPEGRAGRAPGFDTFRDLFIMGAALLVTGVIRSFSRASFASARRARMSSKPSLRLLGKEFRRERERVGVTEEDHRLIGGLPFISKGTRGDFTR